MTAARVDRPSSGSGRRALVGGRALVLTAGYGTRLQPLTALRAKPAVPVAGQPLVCRILTRLAAGGLREAVLNLHHRPETITSIVGDGADLGLRVRYSWEQPLLGTAGGPRHALPLLDAERFWIINGDTLSEVDLGALADEHARSGALVTMALVPNPQPDRYGGVHVREGWIVEFSPPAAAQPSYHFVGVQLVEARVFSDLPDGQPAESVSGVYRSMLASKPRSLRAFVCESRFQDIGTPADYLETSLALARLESPEESARQADPVLAVGARSRIAPGAHVVRTAIWDDVTIGEDVMLSDCVVGDRVSVPAGTRLTRSVIVPAGCAAPRPRDAVIGDLLVAPL